MTTNSCKASSTVRAAGTLDFDYVLLPEGLVRDRRIAFDGNGRILSVESAPSGPRDGLLALPGMPNAHSHAFQRALVGYTEKPAGKDSFWTWRETMYEVANRITPEDMEVVAAQAFADMLAGGFTSVAEFHYLHHGRDGARGTEMADAVVSAAQRTGIRLALFPVLYLHGGFDQAASARQARFVHKNVDEFLRLVEALGANVAGVAAHSLRAARPEEIRQLVEAARAMLGAGVPLHIHVAEQRAEIEACLEHHGSTPVQLLLDEVGVDSHWQLVHATHTNDGERAALAAAGAGVVLCPLTEAFLGDGLFDAVDFQRRRGRMAVGSDSNARIDAVEELRLLEYGQRLQSGQRLCLAGEQGMATALWASCARAGAAALGIDGGAIAPGKLCDLIVLNDDRPPLSGVGPAELVDAWLTGGDARHIARVYVGGRELASNGTAAGSPGTAFATTLARLYEQPLREDAKHGY